MPDDSVKTWGCQYPQASLSAPGGTGFATIIINKLVMNYIVALRLIRFAFKSLDHMTLKFTSMAISTCFGTLLPHTDVRVA